MLISPRQRIMKNFAKQLKAALTGPPCVSQTNFAARAGISQAKLCRILSERHPCDRPTLDSIVTGFTDAEFRRRLVEAYIRDVVSPASLSYLDPTAENPLAGLKATRLSRKGQAALHVLLRSDHLPEFERIMVDLAAAFRLP
jgi:hypothetical protein